MSTLEIIVGVACLFPAGLVLFMLVGTAVSEWQDSSARNRRAIESRRRAYAARQQAP